MIFNGVRLFVRRVLLVDEIRGLLWMHCLQDCAHLASRQGFAC